MTEENKLKMLHMKNIVITELNTLISERYTWPVWLSG